MRRDVIKGVFGHCVGRRMYFFDGAVVHVLSS